MIDTYDFFGGNGQILSIVNNTLSWIDPPKCCCDDGQTRPRKKSYNCPNCGAPITGLRCAYCDTLLVEPTYYQFNIPYSGGSGGSYCNIRQQLEEAQTQIAQSIQTNFIMANGIQSISLYPYESGLRIDRF